MSCRQCERCGARWINGLHYWATGWSRFRRWRWPRRVRSAAWVRRRRGGLARGRWWGWS